MNEHGAIEDTKFDSAQVLKVPPKSENPDLKEVELAAKLDASKEYWRDLVNKNEEALGEEIKNTVIERFEIMAGYSDWGIDDLPVTEESAQSCIELLKELKPKIAPKIGCDYGGSVIVYWGNLDVYASFSCIDKETIVWFASYDKGQEQISLGGHDKSSVVAENLNNHEMIRNIFDGV